MAASDTEEGGAPAAGGAGQDDAPEPQPELVAAGERTASDDAPAAPDASDDDDEEEGGAGEEEDAPGGLGAAGEQPASDHAPVALAAAAEDEEGAVEAEQDDAPESEDEQDVEEEVQEEDGDATEEDEDGEEEEDDDEDAPTHLPFAPTGEELPDDATTVDPSYTISLIRKLIPKGSNLVKEFSDKSSSSDDGEATLPEYKDQWEECGCIRWDLAASEPQAEHMLHDDTTTVDPSYTISLIRKLIPKGSDLEKEFSDKSSSSDDGESTLPEYEDQWEECGCILWDLAASEPQAEHMIDNSVLEVLLENLRVADSSRVKEVCLGIMGNLACHESLVNAICLKKGLITTVVNQLFLDDVCCLSETFRLLASILRSRASFFLLEAILHNEILSRILWILENTTNLTLLGKSMDFISTLIDFQDGIIQPLLKAGLVDHVIGLLKAEIERSLEGKLDRSCIIHIILHFLMELSAIQSISEVMSSSDRLMEVLLSMIKSPDNQFFDDTTAVDSVISLVHNIIPESSNLEIGFSDNKQNDDYDYRESTWCLAESGEELGFPEVRYGRFKIMKKLNQYSWHLCKYKDVYIAPKHFSQGEFKTCQFCAAAKCTEMNIRRQHADDGKPCDIEICTETLILEYCGSKNIEKKDLGNESQFDREMRFQNILAIGQLKGLLASSKKWERPARIRLDALTKIGLVDYYQMTKKLKRGEPLMADIIVGPDFCYLQANEIYSCTPLYDGNKKLVAPFSYHAIVLVGCGVSERDPINFLNSHSDEFGDRAFGNIMWYDILALYEVKTSYPPTFLSDVYPCKNLPQLGGQSLRTEDSIASSSHAEDSHTEDASTTHLAYQNFPKGCQAKYWKFKRWEPNRNRPELDANWRTEDKCASTSTKDRECYKRWELNQSRPETDGRWRTEDRPALTSRLRHQNQWTKNCPNNALDYHSKHGGSTSTRASSSSECFKCGKTEQYSDRGSWKRSNS